MAEVSNGFISTVFGNESPGPNEVPKGDDGDFVPISERETG